MQPFRNTLPLDDAELDRLEDLLSADVFRGEAMRLDELQGMLCAVASAPEPVLPSVWMPAALGGEPVYESEEQAQDVVELLMRLYNEVDAGLDRGEEPELILYPVDEDAEEYDFGAWADGYLFGAQLGPVDWLEAAGEHGDDLSDLLDDMFLLNGSIKDDVLKHGEAWMNEAAEQRAMQDAADELPTRVVAIHDFWRALRFPVETMRRESPKPGRNDPCPCGSGKKYKQCCGDPKKLH
jgi:uncharacterized protein